MDMDRWFPTPGSSLTVVTLFFFKLAERETTKNQSFLVVSPKRGMQNKVTQIPPQGVTHAKHLPYANTMLVWCELLSEWYTHMLPATPRLCCLKCTQQLQPHTLLVPLLHLPRGRKEPGTQFPRYIWGKSSSLFPWWGQLDLWFVIHADTWPPVYIWPGQPSPSPGLSQLAPSFSSLAFGTARCLARMPTL